MGEKAQQVKIISKLLINYLQKILVNKVENVSSLFQLIMLTIYINVHSWLSKIMVTEHETSWGRN